MSRSSSSAQLALPAAKRLGALQATGKHTKTAAVHILMELQSSGALAGNDEAHQLKRSMQIATEAHAKTMTPYGPVVQEVQLDAPQLPKWDICHPFAFLWHLTMISEGFRSHE